MQSQCLEDLVAERELIAFRLIPGRLVLNVLGEPGDWSFFGVFGLVLLGHSVAFSSRVGSLWFSLWFSPWFSPWFSLWFGDFGFVYRSINSNEHYSLYLIVVYILLSTLSQYIRSDITQYTVHYFENLTC